MEGMKKIGVIIGFVLIGSGLFGQVKLGLYSSINNTWLLNKNVSDAGARIDQAATFVPTFGLQATYLFSETVGISTGVALANYSQNWEGEESFIQTINYDGQTTLKSIDVPLLLRVESEGGTYFEFGPLFSFISGATESSNSEGVAVYEDQDFSKDFGTFNVSGNIGFGIDADLSEKMILSVGLNLGYGFSDVGTEYSDLELVTEEESFYTFQSHLTNDTANPVEYESTNTAFGGLKIGFTHIFR